MHKVRMLQLIVLTQEEIVNVLATIIQQFSLMQKKSRQIGYFQGAKSLLSGSIPPLVARKFPSLILTQRIFSITMSMFAKVWSSK